MKKYLVFLAAWELFFTIGENFASAQGKILVAYFSRTGEEYSVGNITKGTTKIIAEIISQKVGADLSEIKPVKNYPANYDECTKIESREKASKARPEILGKVENFERYDKIFIPIFHNEKQILVKYYTF